MKSRSKSTEWQRDDFLLAIAIRIIALSWFILSWSDGRAQQLGVDFTGYPDSGIGNFGYTLGYDFQVITPVTVVGLAAFDDNSGPGMPQAVPVGLWNQSGTLLASATIPKGTPPTLGAANFFAQVSIPPITLQPGYYTVAAQDDWVQSLNQLPNFTVADGIQYLGYAQTPSPVGSFTYPTQQANTGTSEEALFGGNVVFETAPPTITSQPQNVQANLGSMVAFSVVAGGSPPLNYQWIFDQTNLLAGATNATLIITNITVDITGFYSAMVSNHYGSVTSILASLTTTNLAPILPVIPQQTVNELTLLTVSNAATEPNTAAMTGYSLVGPPAGVSIDENGIILWTPSQTQSPSTNVIITVATNTDPFDSITPHLSATNSFTVVVREVNVSPILPAITTQTVSKLSLLSVNDAATESNIHATLAYELISGPTGTSISSNGVITWIPTEAQSPSTNVIKIMVTATDTFDFANPILSATNRFTAIVAPGLALVAPLWVQGGGFQFTFNTKSGATYTVEYSDDLLDWISIEEFDGSGGPVTVIDPVADVYNQGFYRVMSTEPYPQ